MFPEHFLFRRRDSRESAFGSSPPRTKFARSRGIVLVSAANFRHRLVSDRASRLLFFSPGRLLPTTAVVPTSVFGVAALTLYDATVSRAASFPPFCPSSLNQRLAIFRRDSHKPPWRGLLFESSGELSIVLWSVILRPPPPSKVALPRANKRPVNFLPASPRLRFMLDEDHSRLVLKSRRRCCLDQEDFFFSSICLFHAFVGTSEVFGPFRIGFRSSRIRVPQPRLRRKVFVIPILFPLCTPHRSELSLLPMGSSDAPPLCLRMYRLN